MKKNDEELRLKICEYVDGETVVLMDGFDHCILGIVERHCDGSYVAYDREKVLEELMSWGMDRQEAIEYHDYNQACLYAGEQTWAFIDVLQRPTGAD